MQAAIIPFPAPDADLKRPDRLTLHVLHLDLAAQELTDRGFNAKAGVYVNGQGGETAGLSTDAPNMEVAVSFVVAHAHLCVFLAEEMEYRPDELPLLCDMQPSQTIKARSGYKNGRVFGYV